MEEPLDPNKYHVFTSNQRRKFIVISILCFVLLVPPLMYLYYNLAVNRPSQGQKETTFEINKGDDVFTVASNLKDRDLINSEFLFILYVYLNRLDKRIQAGVYQVKAGTNIANLVSNFQHGTNDIQVTFLEGWRVEEFAKEANKTLNAFDYKKFIDLAKPYEGYLFPDTYSVGRSTNEQELVNMLKDTFDAKTKGLLSDSNLRKIGLNKEQVVTLASIVEREVPSEGDRPIVAGILIKRFKNGMKLDADATTQYAIALRRLCKSDNLQDFGVTCIPSMEDLLSFDWWPANLTVDELNFDSSYNTRKVVGLPPTPISSVSISSIKAILSSVPTDYLYYLSDTQGNMHYAKSLEEHNSNIAKYLSN